MSRWREIMLRETRASAWIDHRSNPWQVLAISSLTEEERATLFPRHT
ncbi:hypothetical protein [Nocardia sp. NBC_00511]